MEFQGLQKAGSDGPDQVKREAEQCNEKEEDNLL